MHLTRTKFHSRIVLLILLLLSAVRVSAVEPASGPNLTTRAQAPGFDAFTWALWDAEGQHLSTEEVLRIHTEFGANVYFFRLEDRPTLDLEDLKQAGITTIKVAHPGYAPFNQNGFIDDEAQVRAWASSAAQNPLIDGLALDIEGDTATTHKHILAWLAQEARAHGKSVHAIPHFALFDRWEGTLTADEINTHADVVWPWLYNRFRQEDYGRGITAMLAYWRDKGVTLPVYPIFDHGRTDYSGITPAEAAKVPAYLHEQGIETVCLFQPHVSYRARVEEVEFGSLWDSLRGFAPTKPAGAQ